MPIVPGSPLFKYNCIADKRTPLGHSRLPRSGERTCIKSSPRRVRFSRGGIGFISFISPYSLMVKHPFYTRHMCPQIREQSQFNSGWGD